MDRASRDGQRQAGVADGQCAWSAGRGQIERGLVAVRSGRVPLGGCALQDSNSVALIYSACVQESSCLAPPPGTQQQSVDCRPCLGELNKQTNDPNLAIGKPQYPRRESERTTRVMACLHI
jgi:hypothetical protein